MADRPRPALQITERFRYLLRNIPNLPERKHLIPLQSSVHRYSTDMLHNKEHTLSLPENIYDLRQMPVLQLLHHLQLMTDSPIRLLLLPRNLLNRPEHLSLKMNRKINTPFPAFSKTAGKPVFSGKNLTCLHAEPPLMDTSRQGNSRFCQW